jgi:hypothetical protein
VGLACTRAAAGTDLTAAELSCWQSQPQADKDGCSGATTTTCVKMGIACLTCPAGCQATIDTMYADCDGVDGWEATKVTTKASVQLTGCDGAAASAPALFVLAAAVSPPNIRGAGRARGSARTARLNSLRRTRAQVVNHFLN